MWIVLLAFLLVVVCWAQYEREYQRNRQRDRYSNRSEMPEDNWNKQSIPIPNPNNMTEKSAAPKAAIFDTPPNPEEVEIASNPSTDPEVLAQIGKTHQRRSIRRHVASNPNTPIPKSPANKSLAQTPSFQS